ncbi:hypothetical protein VTO73DRAFT_9905 [Trametes versicolor]
MDRPVPPHGHPNPISASILKPVFFTFYPTQSGVDVLIPNLTALPDPDSQRFAFAMDRVALPDVLTFAEFVSLMVHTETVVDLGDAHAAMRRVLIADHAGSDNDTAYEIFHSARFRDPQQDAQMSQLFRRTYSHLSRTHDLQRVRDQLAAVTRDRDSTLADLNSFLGRTPPRTRTDVRSEPDHTCTPQASTLRAALARLDTTVALLTDLEADHEQNVRDVDLLGDYRYSMTAEYPGDSAVHAATRPDLIPSATVSVPPDTAAQPPIAHPSPSQTFSLSSPTTIARFRSPSPDVLSEPPKSALNHSVRSRHSPPAQLDPAIAHRLADRRLELAHQHAHLAAQLEPLHDRIVALSEKECNLRLRLRSQLTAQALESQIQPIIQERNAVAMEHGAYNIRAFYIRKQLKGLVRPTTPRRVPSPARPASDIAPLATSSSGSTQRNIGPSISSVPRPPRRSLRLMKQRGPSG